MTHSTSVQEEAVVTDIMIALRPREFFEQHLQDSSFVKELPPSDAELIGAAGEYFDYEENDVLFMEGDDADAMYFVVTGTILIFTDKVIVYLISILTAVFLKVATPLVRMRNCNSLSAKSAKKFLFTMLTIPFPK